MGQPFLHFVATYWVWALVAVALLGVVYLVTSIGLLLSSGRRNAQLREQNELLRYQNELLKWLGNQLKERGLSFGPSDKKTGA